MFCHAVCGSIYSVFLLLIRIFHNYVDVLSRTFNSMTAAVTPLGENNLGTNLMLMYITKVNHNNASEGDGYV